MSDRKIVYLLPVGGDSWKVEALVPQILRDPKLGCQIQRGIVVALDHIGSNVAAQVSSEFVPTTSMSKG